jgi:transcriptional regulator with XRE-family HTH domain
MDKRRRKFDGAKLRHLRELAGLSRIEFGERSSCYYRSIGLYERERFAPRPAAAERIANALGVPVEDLFLDEPPPSGSGSSGGHPRAKEGRR